ncbi:MAG: type II toxin-antitoxin system death-on-curing family toxin [Clostridia bacterium]|nr:type II toxin-antitoxin system death-on-curing family toxin [Clostridia bacterium]
MIKFSKDKVLLLHQLITQETGGSAGVRDFDLLESALESAFATFDGNDLYPGKEEKAAKIGYSLISNHAFVDGNKRIGMYVMLTFLEVNGIRVDATNQEVEDLAMSVASGQGKYQDVLDWIKAHDNY